MADTLDTLRFGQLMDHIRQYDSLTMSTMVVIRGEYGDFTLAAAHVESGTLVLDMGQPLHPVKPGLRRVK